MEAISGLDLVLEQVRDMESCTNKKKPLALSWGRTPRLDSGARWPEWDPCRVRIHINRDCRRGFPSVGDVRKRLDPIHVRLVMSGSCQCNPGLSSGLLTPLGVSYPTGITFDYFKSHALVDIVLYTYHYLAALCIYYTNEMDLFAFIRHSDPTKVRVGERNLAKREVKLLKMTEGRTVSLNPPLTSASGDGSDSVDKMFDEGSDVDQEHLAEKDDDVLEEVVAEKAKKKRKRKVTGDASGSVYPPKKLRDDYQPLPPPTGGKSLTALRGMVPEGSVIPSDVMGPLVTASVTPISDVGPVDSVSGLNLRTRPPYVRYVVSSDSSYHSASYSEAASLVRSPAADVPLVTVAVTTTVDADIAAGAKAKDTPKDFEHIGDSASTGGVDTDTASISKSKKPSISLDSLYASQSLDTETMHHVYVPRWKVTNDSVLDDPDVCRVTYDGVRMLGWEHTLERKGELEDKCAEQTILLSEKDAEIAHLKSLLSLKEAEAAEAISLRRERNVATLTADLSGFQLSRDELNSKLASSERDCLATQKSSLESAFEFLKEHVEKMQDKQVGVLSERITAIDSDLMEMVLHMDTEFYPRYLTTIAGWRWILSRGLKLVLAKCLSLPEYLSAIGEAIESCHLKESDYVAAVNALQGVSFSLLAQLEANKDASMADVMDLLHLEGPAAETSEASQLQPSLDQLMVPVHQLEDQVIIGEAYLAFSLEMAHNRV
ncbi:hypothetical protein Tco_0215653 [Tanacetum coccineum]